MKINLTFNNKKIIGPKNMAAISTEYSYVYLHLETNEDNINIIKDIKENFITLHNSSSFIFIETKDNVYSFNTMSFYERIPNNFDFSVVLMDDNKTRNKNFDNLYLSFEITGFKN